jgi:hypothetical protein
MLRFTKFLIVNGRAGRMRVRHGTGSPHLDWGQDPQTEQSPTLSLAVDGTPHAGGPLCAQL